MENINNDTLMLIWTDIKNGGTPLWIFLFLISMFALKQHIINIISSFGRYCWSKIFKQIQEYNMEDVKKHILFKDLDFWLTYGISSLKITNIKYMPLDKEHMETEEYLKAKEEIAKDILEIKFKSIQEYMKLFITENDLEKIDLEVIKTYFNTYWSKCIIQQRNKYIEMGIPKIFLKKFFIYEKTTSEFLIQTIDSYFDEKIMSISIPSRVYLALSAVNNYLTDAFNNMIITVSAINGDLHGVEYKGSVIGEKKTEILLPPHPTFVMQVHEILTNIMSEFKSNRVSVLKYFKHNNKLVHSTVYEVCDTGILPILSVNQKIPTTMEGDALNLLRNHTIIATDISKFNNTIACRLSDRGSKAVILVPIFEGQEFSGLILLDYLSIEEFNTIKDMENLDDKLNDYSNNLMPFISYPKDYVF